MTRIHYNIIAVLAACVALVAASCTGAPRQAGDRPVLAVSIPPQAAVLQELVDTAFTVVSVMPAGANPETYDPSVSERAAVNGARAYFTVGTLPFEQVLTRGLDPGVEIVATALGIEPVTGTHSHHHGHGDADDHHHDIDVDPHVWTSWPNTAAMAAAMAQALGRIDPARADLYAARADSIAVRCDRSLADARRRIGHAGVRAFAVWHPSLSYYARDLGLSQIAVGQESKEISVTALRRVVDEARSQGVRVMFFQREFDSRQAQTVNAEIGSALVTIDPLSSDWEEQLNLITDAVAGSDN